MKASYLKPLLPLRDIVIFPSMVVPLFVGSFLSGLLLGIFGYRLVLFLWRWQVIKDWETRRIERKKRSNRI